MKTKEEKTCPNCGDIEAESAEFGCAFDPCKTHQYYFCPHCDHIFEEEDDCYDE